MRQSNGRRRGVSAVPAKRAPHHLIIARGDHIRSFTIRPRLIIGSALVVILGLTAAVGAGGYMLLQNNQALLEDSTETANTLRATYEGQIADLHRQIDNVVSRSMMEARSVDQQLDDLVARQNVLNERQQLLTGLATDAIRVGIDVLPAAAPTPMANPLRLRGASDAGGATVDPLITGSIAPVAGQPNRETAIAAIDHAMRVVEADQLEAVAELAAAIADHNAMVADALESIGVDADDAGGIGGPFEPAEGGFDADVAYLAGELETFASLQAMARDLPLEPPLASLQISSSFGRRNDPFLNRPATHTGLDFLATTGTPVRVTGPGEVVFAGTNGGYGRMVEVDHGGGLTTRYAHMSAILVQVGDVVGAGTLVGRAGSTGRSTGPHLHYEVRRNGQAIDPLPFVRAGQEIAAIL